MERLVRHRIRMGAAAFLVLGQVGCAAGRAAGPAVPTGAVELRDRQVCEAFAEADPRTESTGGWVALGVMMLPFLVMPPYGLVVPLSAFGQAREAQKRNASRHEATRHACLEPARLATTLGPEHPEVAQSLETLARMYEARERRAEATALYGRAAAIYDRLLARGELGADPAARLETHARVLLQAGRDTEALEMAARAEAIRQAPDARPHSAAE